VWLALDPSIPAISAPAAPTATVRQLLAELAAITTRPWTLMEVCGGQTHAILRWGLDQLLPPGLRLIHGPGCPVCVTPAAILDAAIALAGRPELILASYGDMLRVPGSDGTSLLEARAAGGDVRLLTSPLQALALARANPDRQVVFLAVGFETTAPATALLARQTLGLGLANLTILCAHSRVAPAMEALLAPLPGAGSPSPVQAFLAAGHVCAVLGTEELEGLVARRQLPVVVSGFGPEELLRGVLACVRQLEAGQARLANAYAAVVRPAGNAAARGLLAEVFEPVDRPWRGLGLIPGGGLALAGPFAALEARVRFGLSEAIDAAEPVQRRSGSATLLGCSRPRLPADPSGPATPGGAAEVNRPSASRPEAAGSTASFSAADPPRAERPMAFDPEACSARSASPQSWPTATAPDPCIAGTILRGLALPSHCPSFGAACTPEHPLGAPMVSSEGACAAYHHYRSGPPP
jgi:hydrogenase expression/formation protein HypD